MSSESNRGLKALLQLPAIYRLVPRLLAAESIASFIDEHLQARPGERILDIGCGPGRLLEALDSRIDYTGFDPSQAYIEAARRKYGGTRRLLLVDRVETFEPDADGTYDIVTALGVLHHLSDVAAGHLMRISARAMKPGGRLVTVDPGFTDDQPKVARALARLDRGRMVRYPDAHRRLAAPYFADIELAVRHDRMRVPYTHFIMRCTGPRAGRQ